MSINVKESEQEIRRLAETVLGLAKEKGLTEAEVIASDEAGYSATVRLGDVETIEYNHDKAINLTAYQGKTKGSANTSDLRPEGLQALVDKVADIARYTEADPCNGLAAKEELAFDYPDLDLYHPWDLTIEDAIDMAKSCEDKARSIDKRITNSEGASINYYQTARCYANSHGFLGSYPSTRYSLSCVLIASEDDRMQRDYEYSSARLPEGLWSVEDIAKGAVDKTVARLGSKTIKTGTMPVLFRADLAASLFGSFTAAIRGGALYRKATFLLDKLGEEIFAPHVNITEDPHIPRALASAPFDAEGVCNQKRELVKEGVLQGYLLDCYSARKLDLQTTGNAGGIRNLNISHGDKDFAALLKAMDRGVIVTETMGQGVNIVTGDYSVGASGFWVENGQIQHAVEGITIASNFKEMFKGIVEIGCDVDKRGSIHTGSVLLDSMTVAGE